MLTDCGLNLVFGYAVMLGYFLSFCTGILALSGPLTRLAYGAIWFTAGAGLFYLFLYAGYLEEEAYRSIGCKTDLLWASVHLLKGYGVAALHVAMWRKGKWLKEYRTYEPG